MVTLAPLRTATQLLNFFLVLSTAFMLWKSVSVLADSHSPIVVVLSGSMEPAFKRGDLLFLWNRNGILPHDIPCVFGIGGTEACGKDYTGGEKKDARLGEIVVYEVRGKDIPIVHRVVRKFGGGDQALQLLTKGDNNAADDTELYARGQRYLDRQRDVVGSVVGYVPFVGYGTILMSDYPWLKTVMLGLMGLTVVFQRE